jgi:spermidine synthase
MKRVVVPLALLFSGLTALVYQVLWTRLLGFVFGTSSEAIGSVLAIFFAGMALGNWGAARRLGRVTRPLRVYGLLELGIGLWALLSLPLLRALPGVYGWVGGDPGPAATAALRLASAAVVLLPPTVAMGATLPVVARGLVGDDATLGRWSAILYAANTLGAVCGAYLCGFWLLPGIGLTASVGLAAGLNVLVAGAILALLREAPVAAWPAGASGPRPSSGAAGAPHDRRAAFLAFFAVSGFVAIGYEIVWSKVFGIVMEGTVYGFSAVLSAYLTGIALGSAAVAPFVDRIRDLPRAFGLLHVAAGLCVAAGLAAVPYLPWAHDRLAAAAGGGDAVHLLFLLVFPIVLAPTALFGAAFPILIRIYAHRAAAVGEGMGRAISVNTAGSIVSSLAVGFWAIPALGMDTTLHALILIDLALAAVVLLGFQATRGPGRVPAVATAAAGLVLVAFGYNGVHAELAVAGRDVDARGLAAYREELARRSGRQIFVAEGRNAIVTVTADETSRGLHTNGLPEAGVPLGPPYHPATTSLLGALPYLAAERPERALVIGLGAGSTVETLLQTPLPHVEVVELEPGVVRAMEVLHAGRPNPLDDPRVTLRVDDGRNVLLRWRHGDAPGYDVIASQPSHPWLVGAANLFTEEFFALARDALRPGGAFALWVNGFRTDREAVLALIASFERVFPGSVVADVSADHGRSAFLLLGMREPVSLDPERMGERLAYAPLAAHLAHHGLAETEALLARFEGRAADFVPLARGARNTDDNAYVETRIPRQLGWKRLDWESIESALPASAPVLPPLTAPVDVARVGRGLLAAVGRSTDPRPVRKMERLLAHHGDAVAPFEAALLRAEARLFQRETWAEGEAALAALARAHPDRPEPWRALGTHQATRRRDFARAGESFAAAFERSGAARDAYDAARALDYVDPERALAMIDRIPAAERARFPRLAWYEAKRALARGERGPDLVPLLEALERYRATAEGRRIPGVNATLARLADAIGDPARARAYRDADRRERAARARPALEAAREALAAGRPEAAVGPLASAAALLPGNPEVARLRAESAAARGDRAALEAALADLRRWAPTLEAAVAEENRLRASAGLPLLPEQPAERFGR